MSDSGESVTALCRVQYRGVLLRALRAGWYMARCRGPVAIALGAVGSVSFGGGVL